MVVTRVWQATIGVTGIRPAYRFWRGWGLLQWAAIDWFSTPTFKLRVWFVWSVSEAPVANCCWIWRFLGCWRYAQWQRQTPMDFLLAVRGQARLSCFPCERSMAIWGGGGGGVTFSRQRSTDTCTGRDLPEKNVLAENAGKGIIWSLIIQFFPREHAPGPPGGLGHHSRVTVLRSSHCPPNHPEYPSQALATPLPTVPGHLADESQLC